MKVQKWYFANMPPKKGHKWFPKEDSNKIWTTRDDGGFKRGDHGSIENFRKPMGGVDVVLGIQWLQSLGTIALNFQELSWNFHWKEKKLS